MSKFIPQFERPEDDESPGMRLFEVAPGLRVLAWKGELPQDGVFRIKNGRVVCEEEKKEPQ